MTDISHGSVHIAVSTQPTRKVWPLSPWVVVFVAGGAGLLAGRAMGGDAEAFEPSLLLLLRFMAAMKFAGVLAAAGLVHWRLTQLIVPRFAITYLAALGIMALAPGLIFALRGIALGAALFHIGLLAFLVLAWKDDGVRLPRRR